VRKVTCGGAVNLDGVLAGADGSLDWLHFSKECRPIDGGRVPVTCTVENAWTT
jgi:hypothetical protein